MRLRLVAVLLVAMASTVLAVVGASPASAATCPDNNWSIADGHFGSFSSVHVRVRTGPSTGCAALGQGEPGDTVQFDCWKWGSDGYTWSHLYDFTRGLEGWSRDDLLTGGGAYIQC